MIIIEQPIEIFNLIHMYEVMCTKNDFYNVSLTKLYAIDLLITAIFTQDIQRIIFRIEGVHIRCSKKFFDHL